MGKLRLLPPPPKPGRACKRGGMGGTGGMIGGRLCKGRRWACMHTGLGPLGAGTRVLGRTCCCLSFLERIMGADLREREESGPAPDTRVSCAEGRRMFLDPTNQQA